MPVVDEFGVRYTRSHRGSGFATGPAVTNDHYVVPGYVSVHVGLARVQATVDGPIHAAIGIKEFGNNKFGPDADKWETAQYGRTSYWMVAMQVTKGDMTAFEFAQFWTGR